MVWFEKVISLEIIEMLLYVEISFTSGRSYLLDYLSGTTSRCIIFRRGNRLRGKGGGSRDVAVSRSTLDLEWAVSLSVSQPSSRNRMRTRKMLARLSRGNLHSDLHSFTDASFLPSLLAYLSSSLNGLNSISANLCRFHHRRNE